MKAATVGIGVASLFGDLGLEMEVHVNADSRTAMGIASRRGAGIFQHVEVRKLWVQDKVQKRELPIINVRWRITWTAA